MTTNVEMLSTGSTIGILGGGQLGRMMALAAARLGFKTHIYCPDPNSPAFDVTPFKTIAAYDNHASLREFASAVDVITFEFENIPADALMILEDVKPTFPGHLALETSQDRLNEKLFFAEIGIETAPFRKVDSLADLQKAVVDLGRPAVLKTRTLGYDGKGQVSIQYDTKLEEAFSLLNGAPAILEGFISFSREVSVISARNLEGDICVYDVAENEHRNHILKRTIVPANLDAQIMQEARNIGRITAEALGYTGVMAVELFVVEDPEGTRLLVNEMAPRVHNSGHWTESACYTSQFEQHIRAICGWPLGSPQRHSNVIMDNILGDELNAWPLGLNDSSVSLHIYGKTEIRSGRKMGHANFLSQKPVSDS